MTRGMTAGTGGRSKLVGGLLLAVPLLGCLIFALGAPVLAWLRTLWPGLSAWLFWPPVALLASSITLSYLLPYSRLSSTLHIIGEALLPLMITLSVLLIPADLLWLVWPDLPLAVTGWLVLALFMLLCGLGVGNARRIRRQDYRLTLAKPVAARRLALVSDLHLGVFSDRGMMRRIVDAILSCQPDLVIIAGDLFDDRLEDLRHPDQALAQLQRLSAVCPVYACEGNHDLFEADNPRREEFIKGGGILWLRDAVVTWGGLQLAFRRDVRGGERMPPAQLLAGLDPARPVVAVDHSPAQIEELWAAGADLVLSGHTHGGQTFPATLLYRWAPLLTYGCRRQGGQYAIVTSGVGAYGTPIRLGVNNEVAVIELVSSEVRG